MRIPQAFTNDVGALERAIRQTTVNGSTSLYNAIYISLKELKNERAKSAEEIRRQAIVVLSDGDDTSSLIEYEEVLDLAKRSETAIYAIGLRQQETGRGEVQGSGVRAAAAVAGNRRARVLPDAASPSCRRSTSRSPRSWRASTRMAYSSKNPHAQRRVAPHRRPGEQARAGRAHPAAATTGRRRVTRALMHLLPLLLYAAAAAAYVAHFAWRDPRVGRLATALLGGGVLAHTFLIGMQTVQAGHAPLVGTSAAISAFVWLLGLSYLYVELTSDERAMGAFVARPARRARRHSGARSQRQRRGRPCCAARCSPFTSCRCSSPTPASRSPCVLGVTYVLLFKEIKAKHLGFFYARLPSLQVLDVMNGRAITVGWVFLTLGVVVGGIWAAQVQGSPDPRAQAMSLADPNGIISGTAPAPPAGTRARSGSSTPTSGGPAGPPRGGAGFQELVALVNQEQVGIIFAYDVTRLARNCTDWYQLLDLCGYRSLPRRRPGRHLRPGHAQRPADPRA